MQKPFLPFVAVSSMCCVFALATGCSSEPQERIVYVQAEAGASTVVAGGDDSLRGKGAPPIVSLTEQRILGIARGIHAAEVTLSKMAKERAFDDRAKTYAEQIEREHTAAQAALEGRFAEEGPVSKGLVRDTNMRVAALTRLEGRTFDVAYMSAEVATQTAIIGLLDAILVSNYTTPENHELMQAMRAKAADGIREAARIQAEFHEIEGIAEPDWSAPVPVQ